MTESTSNSVFKAIADPTRRQILSMMVQAPTALTIHALTENFSISRQAVTKHLDILHEAGLVEYQYKGRERFCFASPEPLKKVYDWLSTYEMFWDAKWNVLDKYLNRM
jgi:DNA-binding transcriptional ArsR family regulator